MRRLVPLASLALVGAILDQWLKYLVETQLPMHVAVPVLPFLALFRTHNTGIAFSMLDNLGSVGLIAITLMVIVFIAVIAARTEPSHRLARIGFALVLGGAIGNLIDRVWHGYVVDYVLFHLPSWSFAVFNLADAFITIGAILIVLEEVRIWWLTRTHR